MELADATRRAERLLVPAAFVTALGNNVQLIAGALLMIRSDKTMLSVGLLFIAVAVPQAVLSPYFGRLADRYDRRRLWIGCDATSAVLALALPVWLTLGGAKGPGVYAANFALAVVAALFFPASNAMIKERVRASQVRRFTANYEMATQAGMLMSATVGGLLVQRLGASPLLVFNAGTFVVSALLVGSVGALPRKVEPEVKPEVEPRAESVARTQISVGMASLSSAVPGGQPVPLVRLILLYAQGSVVVTVFNALLPKLVMGEWGRGAGLFGVVDAIGSLGFLAATVFYKVVGRRFGDLPIAVVGFLACNTVFVLQPQFGPGFLAIGVAIGAFTFGTARIASRTLVMTSVDEAHVGRAFGLANGGGLAATVVVMLGVAELTDHTDTRWGFAATAVVSVAAALAAGALLRGRLGSGGTGVAGGISDHGGSGDLPTGGPSAAGVCHIPANADVEVVTA
ncbi:MFS family permease [Catenulispora sp. MAP12-49]|uniref:MFS transporter n=1 Tax=Catenulispora sp. MAP12-49 TaxID=3156302 RepID=UPI0035192523